MSEGIIINPSFFVYFATITVTYPAGSTLTCTCGSDKFTAETTSGSYTFVVPYAGTWTVTATKGSQSKSANVSITTYNQAASVTLSYALYVVQDGVLASGAITYKSDYGGSSVKNESGYINIWAGEIEGGYGFVGIRSQSINMGDYKTLYADLAYIQSSYGNNDFGCSSGTDFSAYVNMKPRLALGYNTFTRKTISVDISSVTGTNYANLYLNSGRVYVYNIYLS